MAKHPAPHRKRRTDEHRRADVAVKHVELMVARAGHVTVPRQGGADYGLDLEVETFDDVGHVENEPFWILVKAVGRTTWLADGRTTSHELDRRDVAHWARQMSPVILAVHDAEADVAYWAYVRRHFERPAGSSSSTAGERVTIRPSKDDVFDRSAVEHVRQLKNAVVRRIAGRFNHG